MSLIRFAILLLVTIMPALSLADEYDATVTTSSGSYSVPVEVEGGEVTTVHWPNGGNMHVYGADVSGGEASGYNSRGDSIDISIDDYNNDSDGEE